MTLRKCCDVNLRLLGYGGLGAAHRTSIFNSFDFGRPLCTGRRAVFTLVELLVVIAIIAMLVTLLLPAVQSAREAARRAQCQNNLKNLALACLNYESATQQMPPSYTPGPCCGTPSYESWSIVTLPYYEEQALHDLYNFEQPNESQANLQVVQTGIALHVCPSDEGTDVPGIPGTMTCAQFPDLCPESGNGSGLVYARGSYRGNAGRSNGSGMWWDAQQNIKAMPKGWKGPLTTSCGPRDLWDRPGSSASFCQSAGLITDVKLRHIEDGTSKTLLIGEQTTKPGTAGNSPQRRRTFWAYTYTSYNKSEVVPETRTMFSDYERCVQFGDSNPCKRAWGTAHINGGIQFAYTDGAVRSIPPSVDMQVFAAMASIAGAEALASFGDLDNRQASQRSSRWSDLVGEVPAQQCGTVGRFVCQGSKHAT